MLLHNCVQLCCRGHWYLCMSQVTCQAAFYAIKPHASDVFISAATLLRMRQVLLLFSAMFCCNYMLLLQADISDVLPCPLTAIGALQDKRYTPEQVAPVLLLPRMQIALTQDLTEMQAYTQSVGIRLLRVPLAMTPACAACSTVNDARYSGLCILKCAVGPTAGNQHSRTSICNKYDNMQLWCTCRWTVGSYTHARPTHSIGWSGNMITSSSQPCHPVY